jgi:mycothiol system anti-sigma-R factor
MLCDDVKRVAYFYLDDALGDSKRVDFKAHVSVCPDCEARVEVHRRLREFVRQRLVAVPAPDALRQRVSSSLRSAPAR